MELAFLLARNLTMMRPDCFLRWPTVVPKLAELEAVVRAAVRLAVPETPVPDEQAEAVAQYVGIYRQTLSPQLLEQLHIILRRFLAAGGNLDVARWARGATLTSLRAGLLICGDIEVASRLGQTAATAASAGFDPSDVVRDLAAWNVSDEYFSLRRALGLAVA
jgi:hypothetical protein